MSGDRTYRRSRRRAISDGADAVGAADFKARCLELLDRVRETRSELVVTKHGKPVARLVPYDPPERPRTIVGCMKGTVLTYDRPFDPIDGEWSLDRVLEPDA